MAITLLPPIEFVPQQAPCWFLQQAGYPAELLVTSELRDFRSPGHLANFVSYLFRRGVEPANDLTRANRIRWQGHHGSADGRDKVAAQVASALASVAGQHWLQWRTEVVFVVPSRPLLPVDELPTRVVSDMMGLASDLVTGLGMDVRSEVWVSHVDQATPAHLHRLYRVPGAKALYAEVGMALARGAVQTQAGPMARFISTNRPPAD